MKTQQYEGRLPMLRVSQELVNQIKARAAAQNITLAEAHRHILSRGLGKNAVVIPIVGTVAPGTHVITLYDPNKPLFDEAA